MCSVTSAGWDVTMIITLIVTTRYKRIGPAPASHAMWSVSACGTLYREQAAVAFDKERSGMGNGQGLGGHPFAARQRQTGLHSRRRHEKQDDPAHRRRNARLVLRGLVMRQNACCRNLTTHVTRQRGSLFRASLLPASYALIPSHK